MYDIVTIGDCVRDIFIKPHDAEMEKKKYGEVKLCFEHGSKISIDEIHREIGGSACNVAVGMSRLGYQSAIIGATGTDSEAEKIHERLLLENVDTRMLKSFSKMETNFSVIIVYKGDRTVLVYRGLKDYSKVKIPKTLPTKWLYLGPVANSFQANYKDIIRLVSEKSISLAINPGHRQIVEGREALKRLIYVSKVLIVNKEEAIDLTKMSTFSTIKELLKRIKSYGVEVVLITDGKNGAYSYGGNDFLGIKIHQVETIDTTGAGDAFSSGFLGSFIRNNDIPEAMKWGVINSASVVTDFGAQKKLMTRQELEKYSQSAPDVYNL